MSRRDEAAEAAKGTSVSPDPYNPRAAEERRRETLARLGVTEQTKEDR